MSKTLTSGTRKAFVSAVRRDKRSNRVMVKAIEHASASNIRVLVAEGVVIVPVGWRMPSGEAREAIRAWRDAKASV